MKSRKIKKKEWRKRRELKRIRKIQRNKKKHYKNINDQLEKIRVWKNEYKIIAPLNFSIVNNTAETLNFFGQVFEIAKKSKIEQRLFFDLRYIEKVTPDAIMYLIAIINNLRVLRTLQVHCSGNMPISKSAAMAFEKVGFYDYFKRLGASPKNIDTDIIKIAHGRMADTGIISSICDYVNKHIYSNSNLHTKRLYSTFIELMTNVTQHAYKDGHGKMSPRWYVYVENCEKDIRFVFLDTGVGIPTTVRKNYIERIKDLTIGSNDSNYILAALNGEFRTETKKEYRGKGLPEIKDSVVNSDGRMRDLQIISGKGKCKITRENVDINDYDTEYLEGTIFIWNYLKEGTINDTDICSG